MIFNKLILNVTRFNGHILKLVNINLSKSLGLKTSFLYKLTCNFFSARSVCLQHYMRRQQQGVPLKAINNCITK